MKLPGERVVNLAPMRAALADRGRRRQPRPDRGGDPHRVTLISPGTELANWQGKLHMGNDAPRWFPMTNVGYASVGEVVAAGSERVQPGPASLQHGQPRLDRPSRRPRSILRAGPDELSDEQAVFVRLANVSMTTMRTTIAHGGDRVAVIGLGLIGNLAAQVFHACGMQVNAVDLSPARREIAARCGIRAVYGRGPPRPGARGTGRRGDRPRRRRWRA